MEEQQFAPEASQVVAPKDDFWKKYKAYLVTGSIAPIVIVIAVLWMWYTKNQVEEQAADLYRKGATTEIWQSIVQKYPKSSRAADALLNLASDARDKKQYDQAVGYYREFLKFKNHPVAPAVELAIAQCYDLAGKTNEAREAYFKISQNAMHPFYGPASIGLARIYKQQGNIPNARQTLTEFISLGKPSAFTSEAQLLLAQLPEQNNKGVSRQER